MSIPSIKDVAKLAGVSTATVSRVINSPEQVREATRLKVQEAIRNSDYSPNTLARDFRRGSTNIIIVVVPKVGDPFFSAIMRGIRNAARTEGYSILIREAAGSEMGPDEISSLVVSRQADGIILLASVSPFGTEILSERSNRRLPIVIGCETMSPDLSDFPSVHINNVLAARDATDYLISQGHTKIGFIYGEKQSLLTADRELGYRAAMRDAGLDVEEGWVAEGRMTIQGAEHAARHLINHQNPPTAIFCANDEMAMGCIHELKSSGIRVPEDISVMGFDDIRYAEVMDPPLTTIAQPALEIGERVVYRLVKEINRKPEAGKESKAIAKPEVVPHKLIVRSSVTKHRH
ncbi:MAG: LacI family DNA-binding transcriptional regulator [Pseudomonadota bacterium]